jgi:hypothetical protein
VEETRCERRGGRSWVFDILRGRVVSDGRKALGRPPNDTIRAITESKVLGPEGGAQIEERTKPRMHSLISSVPSALLATTRHPSPSSISHTSSPEATYTPSLSSHLSRVSLLGGGWPASSPWELISPREREHSTLR